MASFLQHHTAKSLEVTVEETWNFLRIGVDAVYRKESMNSQRYMQLYTRVYQYCTTNNLMMPPTNPDRRFLSGNELLGARLYDKLEIYFREYLTKMTNNGSELHGSGLLIYYEKNWKDFTFSSGVTHNIFQYLNRHWVRREQEDRKKGVYDVYSLCLVTWREILLAALKKSVTEAVIAEVRSHRDGQAFDTTFIVCIRDSFVQMGVDAKEEEELNYYKDNFETPLIEETKTYYGKESSEFLQKGTDVTSADYMKTVAEYMKKALARLEEEKQRVERCLHATTMDCLIKTCEDVLISNHLTQILEEFSNLLKNNCDEDIGNMFRLVSRTPDNLPRMKEILQDYIKKVGEEAIEAVADTAINDPRLYVKTLLQVYKHHKKLVLTRCQNHRLFVEALDEACKLFINNNKVVIMSKYKNKTSELLARYCDLLLKKTSSANIGEGEPEDLLADAMVIFNYVEAKDVFQKFYSQRLAKRLIDHLSTSDDLETVMISKLKDSSGQFYTSKLQKMFTDMSVNQDLNVKFKEHLRESGRQLDVDFNIDVLTHGSWPFSERKLFALPAELETCTERFKNFYQHHQSGRKLTWLYYQSRAEIVTNCFKKRYTLTASTYQVAVLTQYNYRTVYTVQQLLDNTQIENEDLQQVLQTLLKIRILLCDQTTADENENLSLDAKVELYLDYNNKKQRVNINVPLRSAEKKEIEDTHKTIEDDRRYLIEAAIIRIMKTKKTCPLQELIGEVLAQLDNRFKAETRSIKITVDNLIMREYLERDSKDANVFRYLA